MRSGDNGSLRLDLSNMPQPDALLIVRPEYGGRVRIGEDDYIEGGPELVAEVSASSAGYDLGEKQAAYLRNGVLEYIVWRVLDRAVDWFVLRDDRYERLAPGADGILRSAVFPGLWLDPAALTGGDSARVLAVLQQGIGSAEHAGFVDQLGARRSRRCLMLHPDESGAGLTSTGPSGPSASGRPDRAARPASAAVGRCGPVGRRRAGEVQALPGMTGADLAEIRNRHQFRPRPTLPTSHRRTGRSAPGR